MEGELQAHGPRSRLDRRRELLPRTYRRNVAAGSASFAVDPAGVAYLVSSAAAGTGSTPGGAAGISHVHPPGGAFDPPLALPIRFTGAFVFSAGAKVTAVSGDRTLVSDWS